MPSSLRKGSAISAKVVLKVVTSLEASPNFIWWRQFLVSQIVNFVAPASRAFISYTVGSWYSIIVEWHDSNLFKSLCRLESYFAACLVLRPEQSLDGRLARYEGAELQESASSREPLAAPCRPSLSCKVLAVHPIPQIRICIFLMGRLKAWYCLAIGHRSCAGAWHPKQCSCQVQRTSW